MRRTRSPRVGARGGIPALALLSFIVTSTCCAAQVSDVSFGGFFEVTIASTQTAPVTLEGVSINAVLSVGGFSAQLNASLTNTGFDALNVSANGSLGAVALSSTLSFNPSTLAFLSWQSGISFSLFELDVSDILYVTTPQTQSYNQFSLSGAAGEISFRAGARLGICPLCFWEANVCADWIWAECGPRVDACMQVNDSSGFSALDLTMTELILFEDFGGIRGTLDLALSFALESKTVSPTLKIQPSWPICSDIELLGEISTGSAATEIAALLLYGIRGEVTIGESTTVRFADSFVEEKNSALTGRADFFERVGVTGVLPSCCGSPGLFELDAYFERSPAPSGGLLALGLMTLSFDVQLTSTFAFSFEAEFPARGPGWNLITSFRAVW